MKNSLLSLCGMLATSFALALEPDIKWRASTDPADHPPYIESIDENGMALRPKVVNDGVLRTRTPLKDVRTYSVSELLGSSEGTYEIILKQRINVTTSHDVSNNVTVHPYLEFMRDDKKHSLILPVCNLEKDRNYGVMIINKDYCTIPEYVNFCGDIPNAGRVVGNISSDDLELSIIGSRLPIKLPQRKRVVFERVYPESEKLESVYPEKKK
ncbi:hypothetical protein GOV12_07150 [Candidatus Pacearchaeota archaeon]|nr:hypothetical protein [Candidatus Pacearchaeota archaeon]